MRKLLFLIFVLISVQFAFGQNASDDNWGYNDPYAWMVGPASLSLGGGSVSGSYQLWQDHIPYTLPANGRYEWSIMGAGKAYIYPNGIYCSVSFYGKGSYRLLCDVYDANGTRIDGITRYITVN